jgi:uncharacterized repeat protein (TIGR01451 family)
MTAPAAGNFKLRIGHLAPFTSGGATADVRLQDGTVLLDNMDFGDVAPYLELPVGTYNLKITTPDGGTTLIDPIPLTFAAGDILSAFASGDAVKQPLGVYALPAGVPGGFVPLEENGVVLAPASAAQSGLPGEVVTYTLTVTNTGSMTDTFVITYTGNTWAVDLMPESIELGAGDSAEVIVHVTIPAGAVADDSDSVTILATSSNDPNVFDSSELTTERIFVIYLPLIWKAP